MLFWVYMTFFAILIPVTMIGFGYYFRKKAPGNINMFFGYRTAMSMKNNETWIFAHKYCGKIWYIGGFIFLIISVIIMLFVLGKDIDTVGYVGAGCTFLPIIGIIISIVLTENALKKKFNKYGHKIRPKEGKES